MEVFQLVLQIVLIILPRYSIDPDCRRLLQLIERLTQRIDICMVKQGNELQLAVLTGGFTYAFQPACPYLGPALRPGWVGLVGVILGWVPSLHPLRRCFSGIFVRRLRRYYGPICLPNNVHPVLSV